MTRSPAAVWRNRGHGLIASRIKGDTARISYGERVRGIAKKWNLTLREEKEEAQAATA